MKFGDRPPTPSSPPTPPNPANPRERRYHDKRYDGPRKVRHGIKLQNKNGALLTSPLSQRWMKLIEARVDQERMNAGLEYAKAGQIVSLEFRAGLLEAHIQGTAARPYVTRLTVPTLTDAQWEQVIDAMAGEAAYAAKLIADELPATIDELFASLELSLLPEASANLGIECTCAQAAAAGGTGECKHAAAAGYLAAQRLTEHPPLVLLMLGMPADRVLERIRQRRTLHARGVAGAHVDAMIPESQIVPAPLEACIDEYWKSGPELAELEQQPPPQHAPHALLRRMGPSPLSGRFPMVGLLASVYDEVSAAAIRLRDGADAD